jgi:oligoendopeptidase F
MKYQVVRIVLAALVLAAFAAGVLMAQTSGTGAIPQRDDIDDQYKWNVEDIYPDLKAWEADFARLQDGIGLFAQYQGRLAESPQVLAECLRLTDSLNIITGNLYVYAYLKLDEDNRVSMYQELGGRISNLYSRSAEAQSFISPEVLAIDADTLLSWVANYADLNIYDHYFRNLLRQQKHVLSEKEERILALASPVVNAPRRIFNMIENADFKMGTIIDHNGDTVELTIGRYSNIMREAPRDIRAMANDTVQNSWYSYVNTLASTVGASVQKDWFLAQARGYEDCLEMALESDNVSREVFTSLIEAVNANLAPLHKWYAIRKQVLGVDTLQTYDLSVPLVEESNRQYTWEEAKELCLHALEPMGEKYVEDYHRGLTSGWIDVYETEGKGSGAYSWGTYTSHPYILLNYNNKLEDVFTLAHEMGHALNSYYTNQNEPYVYYGHSLFTAEVASTCNEALMMKYLLDRVTDKNEKMALLYHYIRQIDGTFFTQVMFSEFELAIHQHIEQGGAISADYLRQTYRETFQKYMGPDVVIGPMNDMGGMKIGHFYRQFYVYKYATSYAAAQALSQKILEGDQQALDRYLEFLKVGTSAYPVDMLKAAGVDLTEPDAVQQTITLFGELVDEMERLLLEG